MAGTISSTTAARNVQLSSIIRAQYATGRISLPQNGSLFARFKHVQGVPAQGSGGYSASKLQMIDLLVEKLVKLKGEGARSTVNLSAAGAGSDPDALIRHFAGELTKALQTAESVSPSITAGITEPGKLFSLVA